MPEAFRQPCAGPDPAAVRTVGDLASFSIGQERSLLDCDARRGGLIEIIDSHNKVVRPKKWWRWG